MKNRILLSLILLLTGINAVAVGHDALISPALNQHLDSNIPAQRVQLREAWLAAINKAEDGQGTDALQKLVNKGYNPNERIFSNPMTNQTFSVREMARMHGVQFHF